MTTEEHIKFINHNNIKVIWDGQHEVELIYYYGEEAWIKFQNKNIVVNTDNIKIRDTYESDTRNL